MTDAKRISIAFAILILSILGSIVTTTIMILDNSKKIETGFKKADSSHTKIIANQSAILSKQDTIITKVTK